MTRHAAYFYRDNHIRFNAIALGACMTGIGSTFTNPDPEGCRVAKDITTLTRLGQPEDVANAILYLASDEASFVSGAVVSVDGGWSCI